MSVADLPPMQPGDSIAAGSLARAIALALADPAFRTRVLEDMRDSPFPEHAIHISSYLAGDRGRALAVAAAQRAGVSVSDLTGKGAVRGGLQLVMRRPMDRTTWTGTGDIVVMGVAATLKERLRSKAVSIAYDILGRAVEIPILSSVPFPFLVIEPIAKPFGPNPEATRRGAPTRARGTISTREEEWVAMYAGPAMTTSSDDGEPSCDPQTAIIECPGETGLNWQTGLVTPSGFSLETCYPPGGVADPSLDQDTDGVVDQCEFELATVFAPFLQSDGRDCNTGREPYWAAKYEVSPIDNQPVIKIFYAISYYLDCGSPNPACAVPRCFAHSGDSEFIIVEVRWSGGTLWKLKRASLSSHFNVDGNDPIDTYAAEDLEYAGSAQFGRPYIWVALGKHANYRSQAACDAGAGYFDTCDSPGPSNRVAVLATANLGRRLDPVVTEVGSLRDTPASKTTGARFSVSGAGGIDH